MGYFSDFLRLAGLKPPKSKRQGRRKGDYWQRRAHLFYYKEVLKWIDEVSPGDWIVDVGSRDTPIILETRFARKTMIDIRAAKKDFEGVEQVEADWFEYDLGGKADVVLCLQVLEHLPDDIVGPFAQKVIRSGKHAIISVPFMWKAHECEYHLQDPVSLEKLESWTQQKPVKYHIETRDHKKRLIALYGGTEA